MKRTTSKLKCAICGKESQHNIILSSNTFGTKTQLDLRVVGGKTSLSDRIQRCPHCNYANNDIEENIGIGINELKCAKYQEILNSNLDDTAKSFILCAILCDKAKQKRDAGMMYHYASWVFDDLKDTENADKYRKKACDRILEVAIEEDDGDTAVQCVDLLRRNGNYKKALELIDEIGKTDIEEIDKILAFEKELIAKKDKTPHFVDEALTK